MALIHDLPFTGTPEEHGVVHALGDEPALVLDLLAEGVEGSLLALGEVTEAAWGWPVIGVGDACGHGARAGGLLGLR